MLFHLSQQEAYRPVHSLEEVTIHTVSDKNCETGKEECYQQVVIGIDPKFPSYSKNYYSRIGEVKLCDGSESKKSNQFKQEGDGEYFDVAYDAFDMKGEKVFVVGDKEIRPRLHILETLDDAIAFANSD